tara:strand:- start:609 stop:1487 length:879 start_codon:yes stop_codon:yes gene_type:complete
MYKILILGGSGLLGSVMVPYLESYGYLVTCFCRNKKTERDIAVNYSDKKDLQKRINLVQPQFIINLVALTDVDYCEENPHEAYIANVSFLENIVEWIAQNGKCHLVQISTDQLYDGSGPQTEENIKLINYYSYSKFMAELVVSHIPSTVIRTNFFGKSNLINRQSFTDWIFASALNNKNILAFDDVYFSPLSMESLCSFIHVVLNNPLTGTFNVGAESGISKADFILLFSQELGLSIENISRCSIDEMKLTANRPKDMRMDCTKFKAAYTLSSMPILIDEIKVAIKEYANGI